MVVFIKIFNQYWSVLSFDEQQDCSGFDIKQRICETKGIPEDDIYLTYNGSILENQSKLTNQNDIFVQCHLRVPGGKGGFGSMLRAIGAQIEKTTNREACRDLSGRRMRDVNDEKKIADWLSKQAERDQEKAKRKQERLERLKKAPKHVFEDSTTYTSLIQENMDSIDDALQKGLKSSSSGQSSSSSGKRKSNDKKSKKSHKKQKLWLDIDEDLSSDSDEESDTRSSCSSMADSDFSVSESSGKCSSTTTTNYLSSGNTSESEHSVGNPSLSNESPHNSQPKSINTEKSSELIEEQKQLTLPNTQNNEQLVKSESDKQEALVLNEIGASDSNQSTGSKVRMGKSQESEFQVTERHVNAGTSEESNCNAKSEVCSSNSASSPVHVERKCENSEKEKEGISNEERGSVQEGTSSSSVSVPLNLDEYNSTTELEALGLDVLKSALMSLGLKCGGTLQQRAERLFSIKGIPRENIDPSLFAKQSGKKEKKK